MEVRTANNHQEVEMAYDLAAKIYGPNYFESRKNLDAYNKGEPVEELRKVIIAIKKDEIIGLVRIIDAELYFRKRKLMSAGITHVCIHPEFREQGIATAMMRYAIQQITDYNYDLSLLFARKAVDGFYLKFGYVGVGTFFELSLQTNVIYSQTQNNLYHCESNIISALLNTYQEIYHETYQIIPLAFYRKKQWWDYFEEKFQKKFKDYTFINVYDGDRFIGYWIAKNNLIIESSFKRGTLNSMIEAVIFYYRSINSENIVLALPEKHSLIQAYKKFNHSECKRYVWDGAHMIKLFKKDILSTKDMTSHLLLETHWSIIDEL